MEYGYFTRSDPESLSQGPESPRSDPESPEPNLPTVSSPVNWPVSVHGNPIRTEHVTKRVKAKRKLRLKRPAPRVIACRFVFCGVLVTGQMAPLSAAKGSFKRRSVWFESPENLIDLNVPFSIEIRRRLLVCMFCR